MSNRQLPQKLNRWKAVFTGFFLLFAVVPVWAQSVSATLKADSNHLLIGDYLNIHLSIKSAKGLQVTLPPLKDTLGSMEVISASKIDTAAVGSDWLFTQTFIVSAYDSGSYLAGPVLVLLKNADGTTDSLFSNAVPLSVNTLDVDTAKPFKAIKAPLAVPYSWDEFLYYYIAAALLLLLLAVAYMVWRQWKKKKPVVAERPKPKDPPHVWAKKELRKLEEEKLWQKDEVKAYYSRMTDILRLYLFYRYDWSALESTTEEMRAEVRNYPVNDVAKQLLFAVLQQADLVKFARMLPMPDANVKSLEQSFQFIDTTAPVATTGTETKKEEAK